MRDARDSAHRAHLLPPHERRAAAEARPRVREHTAHRAAHAQRVGGRVGELARGSQLGDIAVARARVGSRRLQAQRVSSCVQRAHPIVVETEPQRARAVARGGGEARDDARASDADRERAADKGGLLVEHERGKARARVEGPQLALELVERRHLRPDGRAAAGGVDEQQRRASAGDVRARGRHVRLRLAEV